MISEKEIEEVQNSLDRCEANANFFDLFYEIFIASSPEIAEKFIHTDFDRQKRMLKRSIVFILLAAQGDQSAIPMLDEIAKRHSQKERDIPPSLYKLWLECLLEAIRLSDPNYSDKINSAWTKILTFGIEYMIERY